ncbi:MAG: STAS domain-containing protein [Candidatus Acidiferrum sp.]|jgi:anti-sigma B factor antagonist
METAIGIFDSRERAEQAVKQLVEQHIPQESIVFLTRSQSEAMSFGKDLGQYVGGFMGGAVGVTAGCVGAALALIPGFGQVFALGVGGAALLGFLGSQAGGVLGEQISADPDKPAPTSVEKSEAEAEHLLEVLKNGHSLVLVQSEFQEVVGKASPILDRLGLGIQTPTASKPQCNTRKVDGIHVVDIRGKIAFGAGNTLLREAIAGLTAAGSQKVLLNMKDVDFIDSSGIGELVRSHMAIRKQGGELKLAGLNPTVNNLLTATSLNKVFSVEPDEASAIKSFHTTGMSATN